MNITKAEVVQMFEAQKKDFWAVIGMLAAQNLANASAGINVDNVRIVDDLGYFSGQPEYLSKDCPVHGSGKCFLFRFPTAEGVPLLIHVRAMPYKLTDFNPLNPDQRKEYNLALAENGLPLKDLDIDNGLAQTGEWMADNKRSLMTQWQRLDNNRGPSLPSDGSTGMLGHNTEQNQPGGPDVVGDAAAGGEMTGSTEVKAGMGGEAGGGK